MPHNNSDKDASARKSPPFSSKDSQSRAVASPARSVAQVAAKTAAAGTGNSAWGDCASLQPAFAAVVAAVAAGKRHRSSPICP